MKRLLVFSLFLFIVFFTYTVLAQEFRSLKNGYVVSIPEKIHKLVLDPLPAGTYSVGTGGNFATIQEAFNKLETDGVAGNVTLELIDELYTAPAGQYGFLLNGPISGAGPNSRVTIKPAENNNVILEGNGQDVLSAINTSYVTIDGVSLTGPTTLTFHAFYNIQFNYNASIEFFDNSDHNIFRNMIFISDDINRGGGGPGLLTRAGVNAVADSNLFENNFIKKCGVGAIYLAFDNATLRGTGNIIRGNFIGSETDSLCGWGIQVEHAQNTIIENNIIQNLKHTPTSISEILNIGINSYSGLGDIIRNNVIHGVRSSGGYSAIGILLSGGPNGNNNMVYNNMVYDIQSTSINFDSRVAGIQIWQQNNPKIYYNTVYLTGTGANKYGSSALYLYSNVYNSDVKNNIFVNMRDEGIYCASAIFGSGSGISYSDYNDLYYNNTNSHNCLVRIGGMKYNTLAQWQATGKDFHSMYLMPCFCSPALHIDCTAATCLESRGIPITGFDTDFDGDLRHAYLPDIGADEFAGLIPTGALSTGAYSVGTNGFFSSIQTIFNKLETDGIAGNVALELTDGLYTAPTDSFGFKLNGPIPGASSDSRVIIKPAENKNVVIEGNGMEVMSFTNTSFVTMDGNELTGNSTLTFHAVYNNQYTWNSCLDFWNNSDHNIIQNITFICDDYTRLGGGPGFYSKQGNSTAPDYNLIQNNFIKKAGWSIYVASSNIQTRATGNIIRGNRIGSESDSLISWGIQVENALNTIVEDNIVQNIKVLNTVSEQIILGINSYAGLGDIIRNNVVHSLRSSGGWSAVGILFSGGSGSNNMAYNNMVYDIQSSSTSFDSRVSGIQIFNHNSPKVYYNTVYLTGTGANKYGSAALYLYSNVLNADIKNNILVNMRDEGLYGASAIFGSGSGPTYSDYNDLYYDNTNSYNCLVRIGGMKYNTLAQWQATGKDLHSCVEMPNFITPYLHINISIPTSLEKGAIPIAGIDSDFDGQLRNATVPDIGADEFDGIVGIEDEKKLPTEFALEQNYPNPFNPSTTISWQSPLGSHQTIKLFDVLGRELETIVDGYYDSGIHSTLFIVNSSLPSGVYFYRLQAGDFLQTKKMILLK